MADTDNTVNRNGVQKLLHDAIKAIAADDEDRATRRNGVGFDGADGRFGHAMAEKPFEEITLGMAVAMFKLARKYQGQLAAQGLAFADLVDPAEAAARRAAPQQQPKEAALTLEVGALIFRSERAHPGTQIVRDLPHRRWDPDARVWRIALDPRNKEGLRALYRTGTRFSPDAIAALKALGSPRGPHDGGAGGGGQPPLAAPQQPSGGRTGGAEIAPGVVPALRGLEATLHPSAGGGAPGADRPQTGPSSEAAALPEGPAMARVAHVVAPDNSVQYRLRIIPQGIRLATGPFAGPFASARDAQAAADRLNALLDARRTDSTAQTA